nr:sulfite exporter TauE/SafE family protein [Pullulanibacillus pueri]
MLIGLLVGLIIGFSKTGMPSLGVLAVAIMAIVFPAKASVGLLVPMLIVGDIFAVTYYRRRVIWKYLWQVMPWVIVGLICGFLVLDYSGNKLLQILIGAIVLILLVLHLIKARMDQKLEAKLDGSLWFSAILGILAGVTTMIGNAAGGIMSIYLLAKKLDKDAFVGTGAWFYLFVNVIKVPFHASLGLITWHTLHFDILMIPAIIGGALIGVIALKRVPQEWFQRIVLILTAIGGIRLLFG